ncbi:glutamine synthetase family protein [Nocardioides kongjuensis]|uniref:Glutamine synthetase n=1 Tax=Nocardioides kongjuensis TaxID=349522 RepID=A0A852RGL8_9ACTN|nr:glutamine synthetase family protein [Nocardioides kongjuensis]NYD32507.1 glutamine synthetase [Nocardioides kongjuensis]
MSDHQATGDGQSLLLNLVDNSGVTRAKLLPASRIAAVSERGVGLSTAFAYMCVDDHLAPIPGGVAVGDMRLVPAADARRMLAAGLDWAPVDQLDQETLDPVPTCARSAAKRLVAAAKDAGYVYRMAFEFEFTLYKENADGSLELAHTGPGYGVGPFLRLEPMIRDLEQSLIIAGIEVEQIHPEYGNGQIEVSIAPADPVRAADNAVLCRVIVARTALAHGYRASFAPITSVEGIGNGAHLHASAFKDGRNVFSGGDRECGMTDDGLAMVSRLAQLLPDTIGLYAPSVLSNERLRPGMWSGAWVCWGHENREAGVRFVQGTGGHGQSSANCEVKVIDPAANPYLVVAAVVAITQDALAHPYDILPEIHVDPAVMTDDERARNKVGRLPGSLADALDLLEKNQTLRAALGAELLDSFVAVHRHEDEEHGSKDLEARIDLLRWKY